jgi:ankyrin repeat protein
LIELGADINAKNCDLETPLHIAARLPTTTIAFRLLELGANFEALTSKGESALLLAAHAANYDLVASLIRRGANAFVCDDNGRNALHYAAMGNHGETFVLFKSLLGSSGATHYVNAPDDRGRTLLHYAATARWKAAFIDLLLDVDAKIDARDCDGKTPADLARDDEQIPLADYLDRRGASANPSEWLEMPLGPADFHSRPPSVASSFHDDDSDTNRAVRGEEKAGRRLDKKRRVKGKYGSTSHADFEEWRLP